MSGTIKQQRVKVGDYPRSKNIMAEEKNIMTGGGELVTIVTSSKISSILQSVHLHLRNKELPC